MLDLWTIWYVFTTVGTQPQKKDNIADMLIALETKGTIFGYACELNTLQTRGGRRTTISTRREVFYNIGCLALNSDKKGHMWVKHKA